MRSRPSKSPPRARCLPASDTSPSRAAQRAPIPCSSAPMATPTPMAIIHTVSWDTTPQTRPPTLSRGWSGRSPTPSSPTSPSMNHATQPAPIARPTGGMSPPPGTAWAPPASPSNPRLTVSPNPTTPVSVSPTPAAPSPSPSRPSMDPLRPRNASSSATPCVSPTTRPRTDGHSTAGSRVMWPTTSPNP